MEFITAPPTTILSMPFYSIIGEGSSNICFTATKAPQEGLAMQTGDKPGLPAAERSVPVLPLN